jgi:hypothetical protein
MDECVDRKRNLIMDHILHILDVKSSCCHVCANQNLGLPQCELFQSLYSLSLLLG